MLYVPGPPAGIDDEQEDEGEGDEEENGEDGADRRPEPEPSAVTPTGKKARNGIKQERTSAPIPKEESTPPLPQRASPPTPDSSAALETRKMSVPEDIVGYLVGQNFGNLKWIRHTAHVKIHLVRQHHQTKKGDSSECVLKIVGTAEAVEKAVELIEKRVQRAERLGFGHQNPRGRERRRHEEEEDDEEGKGG